MLSQVLSFMGLMRCLAAPEHTCVGRLSRDRYAVAATSKGWRRDADINLSCRTQLRVFDQ
jgi:hypothetical protein